MKPQTILGNASETAAQRLEEALWSLGTNPQFREIRSRIWHLLWARSSFNDWFPRAENDHFQAKVMPRTLSSTYQETLEEIKRVAKDVGESLPSVLICSVADHKLAALRHKEREPRPESLAASETRSSFQDMGGAFFQKLSGALGVADKLNYDGYVCAAVESVEGECLAGNAARPAARAILPAKTSCRLALWMTPKQPRGAWADQLLVETGIDEDVVSFSFEVDCATLRFPFGRKRPDPFHRREISDRVFFDFTTPANADEHQVYVKVFQGSRFVKSLVLLFKIHPTTRAASIPCPPTRSPRTPSPTPAGRRSASKSA